MIIGILYYRFIHNFIFRDDYLGLHFGPIAPRSCNVVQKVMFIKFMLAQALKFAFHSVLEIFSKRNYTEDRFEFY